MNFGEAAPKGAESFVQFDSLLRGGKLQEEEKFDGDLADETVYLCYSSGTTGLSKGVEVRHSTLPGRLVITSSNRRHITISTLS
jgi:4-coumarate--CoA ligase